MIAQNNEDTPNKSSSRELTSTTSQDRITKNTADANNLTGKRAITIRKDILSQLSDCQSGTCARRVLSNALLMIPQERDSTTAITASSTTTKPLYQSITIPKGASSLTISDAELAIQTNIRNAKYSIMELIDLKGDGDANRASVSLLLLFVASSISLLGLSQIDSFFSFINFMNSGNVSSGKDDYEIWRFVLVWILNFAPLAFVGYGLAAPQSLQTLLVRIQCIILPSSRQRMVYHEAGHFLMAHLLGYPIRGYGVGSGASDTDGMAGTFGAVEFYPLRDDDVGMERASLLGFDSKNRSKDVSGSSDVRNQKLRPPPPQEDRPYFSNGGRGEDALTSQSVFRKSANSEEKLKMLTLPPKDDMTKSWPFRGLDHETLDRLAVVSVAGVCSEILAYGNAEGGYADFAQLRALMESAKPDLTEKEMENRIRYSIGFAMGQLRRHLGALDALVEAMEKGASVEECVLALECCENVSGVIAGSSIGSYEKQRRQRIQNGVVVGTNSNSWLESVAGFLLRKGVGKSADVEDDTVTEGKGGGDRKEQLQTFGIPMSGDDPLYAALAVALIFLVYASSGGLSLH
eukprot:CAMPEP_0176503042 /NCGR_PEP_ID=MMETSP0200_2-20121128/15109_1 /TAXON_ID=947934 /ORGANISM="Chaetoceros sp., Strain GSL56" /LENGTH=575 /DNA_ID=CAMNT_0017902221 /DNA_START=360 /DNA_END=2087 /DNA_ORIENTATION=-